MKTVSFSLLLLSMIAGLSFAQNVNIPDTIFLFALIEEGVDTDEDSLISYAEAEAINSLNIAGAGIIDMTGIEAFVSLDTLLCGYNEITSLDLSDNVVLKHLQCRNNLLTNLDVSNSIALTTLQCNTNQLANLDVLNNIELLWLECSDNQLTSLDVSNCVALEYLDFYNNQVSSLDVSNNNALVELDCGFNQLTSLDVSGNPTLRTLICTGNQIPSLNVSGNSSLSILSCTKNHLSSLDVSNNTSLTYLVCAFNQLSSLDVSNNTALTWLDCQNNQISSLDVLNNTVLARLYCGWNQLTSLDVSNNTALERLSFEWNHLTRLDVSKNNKLMKLHCEGNRLTFLDVLNNRLLNNLIIENMPTLYGVCILTSNVPNIYKEGSPNVYFTIDCKAIQFVNITDLNFLHALIEEGVDIDGDSLISYVEAEAITSLNLSTKDITDLTRIQSFVNLSDLDVSNNPGLIELYYSDNQLASLDISNCTALTDLFCSNNQLTSLDVSNCTALVNLDCSDNQLSSLDISQNLFSLNVLNIMGMPALEDVCVWTKYFPPEGFYLYREGSPNVVFSTECNTGMEGYSPKELSVYPNPANDLLTIETNTSGQHIIEITSLKGHLIFGVILVGRSHQIDLSFLQKGVYLITIRSRDYVRTERIIKY